MYLFARDQLNQQIYDWHLRDIYFNQYLTFIER